MDQQNERPFMPQSDGSEYVSASSMGASAPSTADLETAALEMEAMGLMREAVVKRARDTWKEAHDRNAEIIQEMQVSAAKRGVELDIPQVMFQSILLECVTQFLCGHDEVKVFEFKTFYENHVTAILTAQVEQLEVSLEQAEQQRNRERLLGGAGGLPTMPPNGQGPNRAQRRHGR